MAGAIRRWQRYLMAKSRALDLSELLNPTNASMIRQNSNRGAILFRLWDRLAGTRNLFQNEDESLFRAISRYTGKAREQLSHQS